MITMTIAMMISLLNGTMGKKKRRAQTAKIKEELLPIAWHPDRVMDWCMSEDEKRRLSTTRGYILTLARPKGG